ncbi:MAG TPA: hypothetical protein VLT34_16370 [Arthrobacter sp.]|nr:hypothetical protein [Arthrobacter sp.]
MALGALLILTAVALFSGATWARIVAVVAVVVAGVSAVVQLMLIPAQPWWSLIAIAVDVLIIYALIAHSDELRTGETPTNVDSCTGVQTGVLSNQLSEFLADQPVPSPPAPAKALIPG